MKIDKSGAYRTDKPVFDVANDDRAPAPILDDICAIDGTDDTPTNVGALSTYSSREAARARREAEKTAMALAKASLAARQGGKGDDYDGAANDNEEFPLLAVLRRDKLDQHIRTVMAYRRLVALCEAQPLQGLAYSAKDGINPEHRSTNLDGVAEVDAAADAGWPSDIVAGGNIRYKEVKQLKGGTFSLPPKRAVVAIGETRLRTAPLAVKFSDRVLLSQIDSKPVLASLRSALGPLLEPFEDAVLAGQTFTSIGDREGFKVKPDVAGKALVMRAIVAIEGAWHDIVIEHRRAAKDADKRARLRRAQLAIERARYFGRAA
ncbi:MAG: hypothetical protein E5X80_05055 [Mesorhizobium sp.]|uniref:hypothetical protein n=1 Tax=Mesorhizobium sp. TaxID=1871066 RepID=UPI001224BFF9|nr:hypothetical protein [Mesorhizobium sp.]TIO52965.1 MAG: hypothetical protein E5X78_09990 [Mesorhizobium sp.]TIO61798.1 MAG: hypothetical protein E5X79_05370 [Mesorhizobium sp.]TJV66747.1 MAG: hypothetical protein E5X80_05055 [Mesorhizobium sp.]